MFEVILMNAQTLCYEIVVKFDNIDDAFKYAARRCWHGASVHLPNGEKAALFKRGRLYSWLVAYEDKLCEYDPTIMMV